MDFIKIVGDVVGTGLSYISSPLFHLSLRIFPYRIFQQVTIGRRQGDTPENLLMEIKSVKLSHNKEFSECVQGVVPSLLNIILEEAVNSSKGSSNRLMGIMSSAKTLMAVGGWGYTIIKPLIQSQVSDGLVLIEMIEEAAVAEGSPFYSVFRMILQVLHESELLAEEALDEWISRRKDEGKQSSIGKLFNEPQVQEFVHWLHDEDEDDDEDEEGEEED